jgi:hypothetical protein
MNVTHITDSKQKLIITAWEGKAVDSEFIEALDDYQRFIQFRTEYSDYNEVLDLTKVTKFKLTTDGLVEMAKLATRSDNPKDTRKLAIIVPSELSFILAKIYAFHRNHMRHSTKQLHIFRNRVDALNWLKEKT